MSGNIQMYQRRKGRGNPASEREAARIDRHRHDQAVFHRLLELHEEIDRQLEVLPDGIRSITRSQNAEVIQLLHDHVPSMHERLQSGFRLRRWDPLYEAIFDARDKIVMKVTLLSDGVEVTETSEDAYVAELIKSHGATVSAFAARGQEAAALPSPMPSPPEEVEGS